MRWIPVAAAVALLGMSFTACEDSKKATGEGGADEGKTATDSGGGEGDGERVCGAYCRKLLECDGVDPDDPDFEQLLDVCESGQCSEIFVDDATPADERGCAEALAAWATELLRCASGLSCEDAWWTSGEDQHPCQIPAGDAYLKALEERGLTQADCPM